MVNPLVEEYHWNIVAAERGQYDVLNRNRWARCFLLMAREVERLQTLLDGQGTPIRQGYHDVDEFYRPDAVSDITK